MKNIKLYLLSGIAMLMLTACPGPDPKPNPVVEPEPEPVVVQTYTQEIVMPPKASEQVVTLNQFSTAISTVENSASWLTVEQLPYESGSPKIKLSSTDNTDKAERKCTVSITASSGDKVILSVTQQSEGTGIDDLHGSQTDKPAYSRQK